MPNRSQSLSRLVNRSSSHVTGVVQLAQTIVLTWLCRRASFTGNILPNTDSCIRSEDSIARLPIKMEDEQQEKGMYAIFVHAGAGYHSREHEAKHLDACRLYVLSKFYL